MGELFSILAALIIGGLYFFFLFLMLVIAASPIWVPIGIIVYLAKR